MNLHMPWGRILRFSAVGIGLVALVSGQQRILRWRAERLLADIRAIQMGKSTWADAQRLMNRWGAWGMWDGTCTADSCDYQIALQDGSHALSSYFWTGTRSVTRSEQREYKSWQLRLYSMLGGRVAQVYADIRVEHGIIWAKSYTVMTARDVSSSDLLVGSANGGTRFTPDYDWELLGSHPEYTIRAAGPCAGCRDGACSVCEMIGTHFTPLAEPRVANQLSEFDLSCITKWLRCSEPREIMPAAWKLYVKDDSVRYRGSFDWPSCEIPIEVVARDYHFVLMTRVEEVKAVPEKDGYLRYEARLEPIGGLKGDAMSARGLMSSRLRRVRLGWSDTVLPGGTRATDIREGSQIIFLFDVRNDNQIISLFDGLPDSDRLEVDESGCSYVPDTAANRAAVRRGIERDVLAEGR